jgi:hypothetical protein
MELGNDWPIPEPKVNKIKQSIIQISFITDSNFSQKELQNQTHYSFSVSQPLLYIL